MFNHAGLHQSIWSDGCRWKNVLVELQAIDYHVIAVCWVSDTSALDVPSVKILITELSCEWPGNLRHDRLFYSNRLFILTGFKRGSGPGVHI
jgi:hypothetical protein